MPLDYAGRGGVGPPTAPLTTDDDGASTMAKAHPTKTDLTAEYVRSILDYDPKTGLFIWRRRPLDMFASAGVARAWNTRYAGSVAGSIHNDRGRSYIQISVRGRMYWAHRLAWLHYHGEWPSRGLDHKDTDGTNNRIDNLRCATQAQNVANSRLRRTSRTGLKGVSWNTARQKFVAQIKANGQYRGLGYFDTPEEAHAAYVSAAKQMNGEFARTS